MTTSFYQFCSVMILIFLVIGSTHYLYQWINHEQIVYRRAEQEYRVKHWSKAAEFYESSLRNGLKRPEALIKLAHVYVEMKHFSKARKIYEIYLKLNPKDLWALRGYAAALVGSGKFNEAAKVYELILEISQEQ